MSWSISFLFQLSGDSRPKEVKVTNDFAVSGRQLCVEEELLEVGW
jgi:hypothetical protein